MCLCSGEQAENDWYEENWNGGIYGGKVYGIWTWSDIRGIWYWKDLLGKAGVSPDSLKTWDGYIAAAKKLNTVLRPEGIEGVHLTGASHSPDLWYPYLWMLGGDTFTPIQERVYIVTITFHWVFANTGADINFGLYLDTNGQIQTVAGTETDAKVSGLLPKGSPNTFSTLARVLDFRDHNKEAATMGIFAEGQGYEFTASTMNWTLGLSQGNVDTLGPIDKITLNVLRKLGHI